MRGRIDQSDQGRCDGIGLGEAGDRDDQGGDDDRDRAEQVAKDLEVGAAHVEAAGLGPAQDDQRDEVDGAAHERHREHQPALDVRRLGQPPPRLVEHERGDAEQDHRVDGRREDLRAIPAEGARVTGRPSREPDGSECEQQAGDIGEHVAGVREQREAVGRDASDHLDHQDREAHDQDDDERSPIPSGGTVDVVAAHRTTSGMLRPPNRPTASSTRDVAPIPTSQPPTTSDG